MATPVDLRCPHCGAWLRAYSAYPQRTAYTRCPHCLATLPFVVPRTPAPLFSWEVHPGLYPAVPAPRAPFRQQRAVVFALLLVGTLLIVGVGGWFAVEGAVALSPGTVTLGGTLTPAPIVGAWVNVTGENGFHENVSVPAGSFSVPGVPYGGITLSAGAPGFQTVTFDWFVSVVYSTETGNLSRLTIALASDSAPAQAAAVPATFPNLEAFVATLWSGTGLLAVTAVVAGLGTVAARRGRLAPAVAAGSAVLLSPAISPILGLYLVDSTVFAISLAALPIGVLALTLTVPELARESGPVEPL